MKPVLVVFPFCLDHVGHGNIQRILAIARYLASKGHVIDVVYQGNAGVAPAPLYGDFRRVFRVDSSRRASNDAAWTRHIKAFYSGQELPATHMRPSPQLGSLVRALLEAEPYSTVLGTYAFCAPLVADLGRPILKICDVQDILHEHADACRKVTGETTTFSLPPTTEAFLWRQWDLLVAITPDDAARIRRHAMPPQHLVTARHAMPSIAAAPEGGADDVALYAASDNTSNVKSVAWLLEDVWPRVRQVRPSARLRVAGLICRALPAATREIPGVEVLGFRDDIAADLNDCGVLVAPYLFGSGLKIKVVEAACAGKAVVTTSGGVFGSGLQPGRAIAVHDDPSAFADALAQLLGDRARREALAAAALTQARRLFSPDACYAPIAAAIELLAPRDATAGRGISRVSVDRIQRVAAQVSAERVIAWGNGAHTRGLLAALDETPVRVSAIADRGATSASTSPENVPVVPAAGLVLTSKDLVILSSETYEAEMWSDLAAFRAEGGMVLGLTDPRRVSRGLLGRMGTDHGMLDDLFQPRPSDDRCADIFWDSRADAARRPRLSLLKDLTRSADRRDRRPIIVTHRTIASDEEAFVELSSVAAVAPIIEVDGSWLESNDMEGGPRGLLTCIALAAASASTALAQLALRRTDTFTLVSPTLAECFALARALRELSHGCPAIVIDRRPAFDDASRGLDVHDSDRNPYWRLAVSALADVAGGRLTITGDSRSTRLSGEVLNDIHC
jgi:glycosyltransferase involved in cell wall biosynthesis